MTRRTLVKDGVKKIPPMQQETLGKQQSKMSSLRNIIDIHMFKLLFTNRCSLKFTRLPCNIYGDF